MQHTKLNILLADDDIDDCDFFKDAVDELGQPNQLTVIHDGVELMSYLSSNLEIYPDIIFLDLNMPKKSGMECIADIKASEKLSHIPIIIYSTSLDRDVLEKLYDLGASHYIQKPAEFSSIKTVISKALSLTMGPVSKSPTKENFIIQP